MDIKTGKVTDAGKDGCVDTWPVWLSNTKEGVLFLRGKENMISGYEPQGISVPGGEVWLRSFNGEEKTITKGAPDKEYRMPLLSPDGKYLAYVSLIDYDQGSLFLKDFEDPEGAAQVEILTGLTGGPGFYGNYYPHWMDIYFEN